MNSAFYLAEQIVSDVLFLRGPDPDGVVPFRMHTAEVPVHRLATARRFAHLVPKGTGFDDVPRVAATIASLLSVDTLPLG
jgi:hypothetical protein